MGKSTEETPKRINSKRKGGKNERAIAKLFTKWTGLEFAKTPASGGLRWKNQVDVVGDIVCTDKKKYSFKFCVEAKFHSELNFQSLIGSNKSEVIKFWVQALKEGERSKKIPILMMRYNRMAKDVHYIGVSVEVFRLLQTNLNPQFPKGYMEIYTNGHKLVLCDSRDFFAIPYPDIKPIIKTYLKG